MATQKLEYDTDMGGHITLPTHLPTYHYAANALQEIKSLIADAQQPRSTKLIFQTLPKHMRRRAMSHHPKRLPRKYRDAHKSQMSKAGNEPRFSRRPSRKYRRRPQLTLAEKARRERRHTWLETHIWHAKRFHMIDRWGYRLPYASCDKTYRACYRASAEHCLLQDISYYCCVELHGSVDQLRNGFARLTSSECGLGITARTYLSGRREGSVELFRDGAYPLGALQRVSFMWRPLDSTSDHSSRILWLWLHPSSSDVTIEQLQLVFQLELTQQPMHYENSDGTVQMLQLKHQFNRFRLTGARSQRVLANALRAYEFPTSAASGNNWLANGRREHEVQAEYSSAALQQSSPTHLLSNIIVGFNVVDPRLQRPQKRTKSKTEIGIPVPLPANPPECLPQSVLWDSEQRQMISKAVMSTQEYCKLRQRHAVVPGEKCAFEAAMQPLPLLLIQRPGSERNSYKRLGYGAGWDIIAPARYGLVLWTTLIMWGARPGGLREVESVARESGAEPHLPDTLSGSRMAAIAALERRERYFRLPPNKRCNYRKLAIVSPFEVPWPQLVRDWQQDNNKTEGTTAHFHVLRQRDLLGRIDNSVRQNRKNQLLQLKEELPSNCLIQLQVQMVGRGHLQPNALICLPTPEDQRAHRHRLKRDNRAPVYTEPPLPDLNQCARRQLRDAHTKLLKRLRRRRVREKRRLQETSTRRVHIRNANTRDLVRGHFTKMCDLWLPENPALTRFSVSRQCTRTVCGYVTSAGFSFTEANVCGVGYVTAAGLCALVEGNACIGSPSNCLVRNADSRDYQYARFMVNVNVPL